MVAAVKVATMITMDVIMILIGIVVDEAAAVVVAAVTQVSRFFICLFRPLINLKTLRRSQSRAIRKFY